MSTTIILQGWVSDVYMLDVCPSFLSTTELNNSVEDYSSSRVGVGCRVGCWMSDTSTWDYF